MAPHRKLVMEGSIAVVSWNQKLPQVSFFLFNDMLFIASNSMSLFFPAKKCLSAFLLSKVHNNSNYELLEISMKFPFD